jgi:SAM-dependent methyltransferase
MQNGKVKDFLKWVLPKWGQKAWESARYQISERTKKFGRRPAVGWVRFGSLRRLEPIDRNYGFEWGKVLDRYYIEAFLREFSSDIHGRVLEVAENTYTVLFGGERVVRSDVLHYVSGKPNATIIADLSQADHIPSNSFDCIILTQTLQFIYRFGPAIETLHRILKPGGVLLVTSHGISQISRTDMDAWGEYWRFTALSLRKVFSEVFPESHITIKAYGNVLTAVGFLHGLTAGEFRREELDYRDPDYEVLLGARMVKPQ